MIQTDACRESHFGQSGAEPVVLPSVSTWLNSHPGFSSHLVYRHESGNYFLEMPFLRCSKYFNILAPSNLITSNTTKSSIVKKKNTIPKTGHILIGKISKQLHSVSVFLEVGLYIFNQE